MNVPTLFLFCRISGRRGIYREHSSRLPDGVTGHVLIRLKPNSRDDLILQHYPGETIRIDHNVVLVPTQFLGLEVLPLQALHLHTTYESK